MKILTVIPIAKGIPRDELSYFSAREVKLGTLVTVPFGKRSIKGVVVDTHDVRDLKSSIKTSDFKLRNVGTIHTDMELANGLFIAGQKTARFFAQPVGAILQTMLPQKLFEYYITKPTTPLKKISVRPDIQAMQAPFSERISYYKTLARECLARHESIMIVAPTIIQAEKIFNQLKLGIPDHIEIAHSKKTTKQLSLLFSRVIHQNTPVVLVVTAPFASMIRPDWANVIIEQSSSPHYRYEFGPIFDTRFFIEHAAYSYGAKLLFADTLISTTVRYRISNHDITDVRSSWHIARPERFAIVDMKPDPEKKGLTKPFWLLHGKTMSMIKEAQSKKSNVLLLTTRKGLAPLTSCSDCGTVVSCPQCSTPLVLHRTSPIKNRGEASGARTYICHHCAYMTQPVDHCLSCGGTRLALLGIGTDGIIEELREKFPDIKTYICDSDTATTPSAIIKIITAWQKNPGSILISTPMILPYIDGAPFGCMVSMDTLLSLPAYTSNEHSLHTALLFLEKMSDGAIIQTRIVENQVIQAIAAENIFDYMKDEVATRVQFNYPPKNILAKISHQTKPEQVPAITEFFEKIFDGFDPDSMMKKSKNSSFVIVQVIAKIDPSIWGDFDHQIHHLLSELPQDFKKEINPETAL